MNRFALLGRLVVAFALASAPLSAQDEPSPGAPSDSDQAVVENVLRLYRREGGPRREEACPTSLLKRVVSSWDNFSDEDRERLKPYVLMPGQDRPGATPSAPGQDDFKYARTKNFLVFWKTEGPDKVRAGDRNSNRIPDYVEKVGNYLERAFQKEVVEMGFSRPPTVPQYRVYLRNMNHNGLTHPGTGSQSWIDVHCDIESYTRRALGEKFGPHVSTDPDGIESGLLKAVCAHEFFHAIQACYSWNQPDWWAEGSAEWMGELVFPESDFYLNNLPLHFQQPHVSLFSSELWFEYSASVFTGFVSENLGGPQTLKRIWEACRSAPAETAIAGVIGDLREAFTAFWCYNYLRAYRDGSKYPLPEAVEVRQYPLDLDSKSVMEPQHYGANLFRLMNLPPDRPLRVTLSPKAGSALGAKLIMIDTATKKWRIAPMLPAAGGELAATLKGAQQAVLVIGSFTRGRVGSYRLRVGD